MKAKFAFTVACMLATTSVLPNINKDWQNSTEANTLRAQEKGKTHANCAADLAIALRVQKGMAIEEIERFEQALNYHKQMSLQLSGKDKFPLQFNEAYFNRMESLEVAHHKGEIALDAATKSYVREVYNCIGQMQAANISPFVK